MRPATRWAYGLLLGVVLPVLIAGAFCTGVQHWYTAYVVLLLAVWGCHEQLLEVLLG